MNGTKSERVQVGDIVLVVQKQDQSSGKLTEGIVQRILTKSATHPHGIKVMLEGGIVGRVKESKETDKDGGSCRQHYNMEGNPRIDVETKE